MLGGKKEIPELELPKVFHALWSLKSQFWGEMNGQSCFKSELLQAPLVWAGVFFLFVCFFSLSC